MPSVISSVGSVTDSVAGVVSSVTGDVSSVTGDVSSVTGDVSSVCDSSVTDTFSSVTAFLFSSMASFTVFQYASIPSASVRFPFHFAFSCKYFSLLVVITGFPLVRLSTSFCALAMLASTNASISSSSSEPSIRSATVVSMGAL